MKPLPVTAVVRILMVTSFVALVAGCGGPKTDGTQGGYVSGTGDNKIVQIAPADRKKAPIIAGQDLEGHPISTADWAGKTVVVNLWGSWCPPCRKESPALDAVARAMKTKGVEFIGIAVREDAKNTLAFDRKHDISYPSISDTSGAQVLGFAKSLPSAAIPTTWIIDAEGRVAARIIDATTESTLTGLIQDVQKSTP